jgi:hypothetical protein
MRSEGEHIYYFYGITTKKLNILFTYNNQVIPNDRMYSGNLLRGILNPISYKKKLTKENFKNPFEESPESPIIENTDAIGNISNKLIEIKTFEDLSTKETISSKKVQAITGPAIFNFLDMQFYLKPDCEFTISEEQYNIHISEVNLTPGDRLNYPDATMIGTTEFYCTIPENYNSTV